MFMLSENFMEVVKKANQVIDILKEEDTKDTFVWLNNIQKAVQKISNFSDITASCKSFSKIDFDYPFHYNCGGMLNKKKINNKYEADIIINSDKTCFFQRFAFAHELGLLLLDIPNCEYSQFSENYILCAYISDDITLLPNNICTEKNYLLAEKMANIFALLVLIPRDITIKDIQEIGINELRNMYGVSEEAIYSRMIVTAFKQQQLAK